MDSDGKKSGGNVVTLPETPAPGASAETPVAPIADKADDLEEIKKAVEDAASVSGGLWLSYLFVLSYVAIAAGAVTHADLLLERAVKLPFLNVELPLLAFFALAPFVVLITHIYALMHFRMLGNKARHFHKVLRNTFPGKGDNEVIRGNKRRLLPSNIFVQTLAGPPELRTGFFGFMLKVIALTTLVLFPVLVLLLLQIQFLPFHDTRITWAQRGALFLDVILLWPLRPPILTDLSTETSEHAQLFSRALRGFGLAVAFVMSIAALWFSIVIATIPGEGLETALAVLNPSVGKTDFELDDEKKTILITARDLLFAGEVDETTRRRESLFSNTLVLPGFNIYEELKIEDPKRLAWKEHSLDLRGRHLEQAVLYAADLTKADLSGAQLQGASLFAARLQGAQLIGAELQGASLIGAELQGAGLRRAQLQGASLIGAQLQGASLIEAQLQGAWLGGAQLQGAWLGGAQLQGASLDWAQLQGASFDGAVVNAANFSGAFLWRTDWGEIDPAKLGAVLLKAATWKPVLPAAKFGATLQWDPTAYSKLRDAMSSIPEGKMREGALKRIERLNCRNSDKTVASCDPTAKPPKDDLGWRKKLEAVSVNDEVYEKALVTVLRSLVCANDTNAIHILRGIIGLHGHRGDTHGQLAATYRSPRARGFHLEQAMSSFCRADR
jgi:uncharacterized protein YjbI with pentapeptide repeats